MNRWKSFVWMAAGMVSAAVVTGGLMTIPSIAQTVRAALVRDVDNGALDPQRISILGNLAPTETFKTFFSVTVPPGKRLVIENASVWTLTTGSDRITGLWLRAVNVFQFILLDPAVNELRSIAGNQVIAAYNRPVKAYFNPGEQLHTEVYADGTSGQKLANVYLQGYYVNLP